jgi:hypothetical protein
LALAGLQAGILAGLIALIYLMLDGAIRGRGLWSFANLVSAALYQGRALSNSFRWATLVGMALHLLVSGMVGVGFAFILRPFASKPRRSSLVAACLGLVWYFASCRYLWPQVNPALVIYQPFPGMLLAHLVFGLCMGRTASFAREIGAVGRQPDPQPFL